MDEVEQTIITSGEKEASDPAAVYVLLHHA